MSEERVIRINKVLRELNISLDRAVDYLKDKGIAIDANPNAKISDKEYDILQSQFAGDKGRKEASKEVGEEKRKEKEALRIEREREIEEKRKQDEERQRQEVIKAKAVLSGPKQVGKIDLDPKAPATEPDPKATEPTLAPEKPAEPIKEVVEKQEAPVADKPKPVEAPKEVVKPEATTLSADKKRNRSTEKGNRFSCSGRSDNNAVPKTDRNYFYGPDNRLVSV